MYLGPAVPRSHMARYRGRLRNIAVGPFRIRSILLPCVALLRALVVTGEVWQCCAWGLCRVPTRHGADVLQYPTAQ